MLIKIQIKLEMKKVSILVSTIDSGGAEKQAVLLASQLSLYTEVNLLILYGDYAEYQHNVAILAESTVKVHKLVGCMLSKIRQVRRIIKVSETGVLLNYLTLPDFVGSLVGRMCGIRVYNGIRNSRMPKAKILMEKIAHNYWASGTIYNCYSGAEYFANLGFIRKKNIVIPNCFPNIEAPIIRPNHEIKTIITVGRFDPQKDYKTLIESVAKLARNDFRLCIVGYGVLERQIRAWVKECNIENKTDIFIKPNNVSELERNADIYISTSLFEGTSNSIMEALNWSLPVVATNVGDNERLVIDGKNGYLHAIGDTRGIAESLSILLDSSELRNKMGTKSNQILRENYSMEIFEKRYVELIEEES